MDPEADERGITSKEDELQTDGFQMKMQAEVICDQEDAKRNSDLLKLMQANFSIIFKLVQPSTSNSNFRETCGTVCHFKKSRQMHEKNVSNEVQMS